jgi:hypothetical protein
MSEVSIMDQTAKPVVDPHRCTHTGRTCGGYSLARADQRKSSSPEESSISRVSNPMLVEAGDSVRYLEFYHYCAGQTLSSKFDDGFWTKTTLQLAQAEPSIRNALVALGSPRPSLEA